jgi:hypothetical protein
MSMQTEPRYRVSAKQTAKNLWQLDATIEYKDSHISRSSADDAAVLESEHLGLQLLSLIKETEKAFRDDGRKIVGDDSS